MFDYVGAPPSSVQIKTRNYLSFHRKLSMLFDFPGFFSFSQFKLFVDLYFMLFDSEPRRDNESTDCVFCDDFWLSISVDIAWTGFVTIQTLKANESSDFRASHGEIWKWFEHEKEFS